MHRILFLLLFAFLAEATAAQDAFAVKAMSYNIRFNNPGDGPNAWPNRKDVLIRQVKFYGPDVIGMQEVLKGQLDTLDARLENYAYVGVGRDDGKEAGEYSPLLYRSDRFELETSGTFWLSTTPQQVSKGWDAALPRICTYARLREKASSQTLWVFNTHFDHVGVEARRESVKVIHEQIQRLNTGDLPVIITGDFNVQPTDAPIVYMHQHYGDAWEDSQLPAYGPIGTYSGFQADHPLDRRIDFVFFSEKYWKVHRVAHLATLRDGRWPSDHLPVFAELHLK